MGVEENPHRNLPQAGGRRASVAEVHAERRTHKAMRLQTPAARVPAIPGGSAERQAPTATPAAEVSAVVTPAMAAPMVLVPAVFGPCR